MHLSDLLSPFDQQVCYIVPCSDGDSTSSTSNKCSTSACKTQQRVPSDKTRYGSISSAPSIDVIESPTAYHIRVDLPGINKEDIQVHLDQDITLYITAENKDDETNKQQSSDETKRVLINERYRPGAKVSRKILLPEPVDASKVESSLTNGVLELRLSKKQPDEKRKKIVIQ